MALPAWKRIETSPGYQRLKVKAKRLVGQELRLTPDIEVDCANDGGWAYDASLLDEFRIVYSLGVGNNIDFDLGVIKRSQSNVYAFDPKPAAQTLVDNNVLPRQFDFHAWATAGENNGIDVPSFTIATLVEKLGHSRIDLLKIEMEGAEYTVLEDLLASPIRPKQLLVGFHHRHVENGLKRMAAIIGGLREEGYRIIYVCAQTGRDVSFRYLPEL